MPGVGAQVHQHLLHLRAVHRHLQRRVVQAGLQVNTRRQGGAQQGQRLLHQRTQQLRHALLRLPAAEGQDLLHQVACTQA